MRAEERIAQLEAENAALREQLAQALAHLAQALERIHELEGRLAKDSHNSSKPPRQRPTRRKQDHAMLAALAAVFVGKPLPVA